MRCRVRHGRILALPPERRSPTRQVLSIPRKRAGSEIGAPPLPPNRGQYQDAPDEAPAKFQLAFLPSFLLNSQSDFAMMTSSQIRQSFMDFFRSKQHIIVPSSSLMPDSPNLLFTNAGMNQFVPNFLGQTQCPYTPGRAADTQKCIRAGGKHNDLDDVGLDTYHHTFFEMLGNWSFGDYLKEHAIKWAWELVIGEWKFPANRVYATVYCPFMGERGWEGRWKAEIHYAVEVVQKGAKVFGPDKAPDVPGGGIDSADQLSAQYWAELFLAAGLDPLTHVIPGNKKDNFWMMGETGPCGPCSELHVDLTPAGDTKGSLVNKGDARCIEIWNLVFMQFNANPDGTLTPLPAKNVDTGMGFERVTSIIQCTKGFKDFANANISNYETDIFRPIFDALEKFSGRKYGSTLPGSTGVPPVSSQSSTLNSQQSVDIAFRVIADHIRTLSFAIADGIQPGNNDRNYVLRRILRRAVRYGRTLGFHEPFFYKLVDVLADTMGDVFPEIRARKKHVQEVIQREEEAFNKTLDRGIELFNNYSEGLGVAGASDIDADFAFKLYDTYGFPLDLTELMARERGLTVDVKGFNKLMDEQKARARAAQKKEVISLSQIETTAPTKFVGFEKLESPARVLEVVSVKDKTAVVLDTSPFYAEMGGQVGDTGELTGSGQLWRVTNTQKSGNTLLHFLADSRSDAPRSESALERGALLRESDIPVIGSTVTLAVEKSRRDAIQRHHTVTHLLHWALHEVASREASQKGSFVGPDKLTFDFNRAPLTPQQAADIEKLVNERILEKAPVTWFELPYAEVKKNTAIIQFFGEKYGDTVRVLQIGGERGKLNGYSMELCGGTHTRATG